MSVVFTYTLRENGISLTNRSLKEESEPIKNQHKKYSHHMQASQAL